MLAEGSHNAAAKSHYDELNGKIEQLSNLIHVVLMEFILPATVVPALLLTIVNFFIYDLKDESYFMPIPIW